MRNRKFHCWIRVSPYTLRDVIIPSGRFKSRFETGCSSASLDDLERRAETDRRFYGYPLDLAVEQRPIYGYVCGRPDGDAAHGHFILDEYGDAAVRLKDEIKKRTTFCLGDSLFGAEAPVAFRDDLIPEDADELIPFVEAQYHGGVRVVDIAEVVLYHDRWVPQAFLDFKARLESDYGIPCRFHVYDEESKT